MCNEKLETVALAQTFVSNACCFLRDKNVVLGTIKGQLRFSKRQQWLEKSGNKISFSKTFYSWKVHLRIRTDASFCFSKR